LDIRSQVPAGGVRSRWLTNTFHRRRRGRLKVYGPLSRVASFEGEEEMRFRQGRCPPAGDKDGVYRIWGTGGEGGLHRKRRCETNEFLEIAPLVELLSAVTRKALNASVRAEGRAGDIARLPR
jgi:hypothetical protein